MLLCQYQYLCVYVCSMFLNNNRLPRYWPYNHKNKEKKKKKKKKKKHKQTGKDKPQYRKVRGDNILFPRYTNTNWSEKKKSILNNQIHKTENR